MTRTLYRMVVVIGALVVALPASASEAPLSDAMEHLNRDEVDRLLARRVDPDAAQMDGMTALHWAVYHDTDDLVARLLEAGADASVETRYGVTPLGLACTNGNLPIVERLLEAGADPSSRRPGGETVLMTAARVGRIEVVRALLARGADPFAREARRGQTALMWAAAEGHADVVALLIELGANVRTPLDTGFTPLLFAVREGHIDVTTTLLEAGADVNGVVEGVASRDRPLPGGRPMRTGTTPLLLAVTNGHFELATRLLEAGADPNLDVGGYTVLHAVPRVRKPGVGDNDPAPDGSGAMDALEFVRAAAAHGADLDARMTRRRNLNNTRFNEVGATPFMLAALVSDTPLMRVLAELGVDPLVRNAESSTALMAAAGLGTRSPGEDAGTEDEVLEAVQLALDLGADIDAVDDNGETAMHGAAYKNLPRVVELLTERGASVDVWNRRNRFGWAPLTIARGYRFGNFKPSPVTVSAIEAAMRDGGVTPPTEDEEQAEGFDIYAPRPPVSPAASPTPPR